LKKAAVGAKYCNAVPRRSFVPVFRGENGESRVASFNVRVQNTTGGALNIYTQVHGGFGGLQTAYRRDSGSDGIVETPVAAGFGPGFVTVTMDLDPRLESMAGAPSDYPGFSTVGLFWDDGLSVESYSVWDEEA